MKAKPHVVHGNVVRKGEGDLQKVPGKSHAAAHVGVVVNVLEQPLSRVDVREDGAMQDGFVFINDISIEHNEVDPPCAPASSCLITAILLSSQMSS